MDQGDVTTQMNLKNHGGFDTNVSLFFARESFIRTVLKFNPFFITKKKHYMNVSMIIVK